MFEAVDTTYDCVRIATGVLSTLRINPDRMLAGLSADMLATDLAEYLVRKGELILVELIWYRLNLCIGAGLLGFLGVWALWMLATNLQVCHPPTPTRRRALPQDTPPHTHAHTLTHTHTPTHTLPAHPTTHAHRRALPGDASHQRRCGQDG